MKARDPNNPSSTFYWKDYENDEGLRISSLPAQGLWMRLLCVAAKGEPFGYILVNGYPLDATGVARLASVTEGEATALVEELERNGVFSRDRKGRMFSRRMVREAAKSAKNRKNGQKGGNPALKLNTGAERENGKSDNRPLKGEDKPPFPLPIPNEEPKGSSVKPRKRAVPKTRIPPDALISERMRAVAIERGLSDAEAEAQFAKFRDWAVAKGQVYADWDAAWRNWLTSPYFAPVLGAVHHFPAKRQTDAERLDDYLSELKAGVAVRRLE